MIEVRPIKTEGNVWELSEDQNFKRPISLLAGVENGKYRVDISEERLAELTKMTGLDLTTKYNPQQPHPFYDSAQGRVKLENNTMFLDTSDPLNEIKVGILRGHPKVANSQAEFEEGLWPEAEFVMYDAQVEVAKKATKAEKRMKAYSLASKIDVDQKQAIIAIMTGEDVRKQSTAYVDGRIDELIESEIDTFIRYADKVKQDVILLGIIANAKAFGIITEKDGQFRFGDIALGINDAEILENFKQISFRDIRVRIQEKLEQL